MAFKRTFCDDDDDSSYPTADEFCDSVDHNCDGSADAGAIDAETWYIDIDEDGFGNDPVWMTLPLWRQFLAKWLAVIVSSGISLHTLFVYEFDQHEHSLKSSTLCQCDSGRL